MSEEEIEKMFTSIPEKDMFENKNFTSYGDINLDDFKSAMKRLNKIPNTSDLLKENKNQQTKIDKAIEYIEKLETNGEDYAGGDYEIDFYTQKELLKILKGEDDE